MNKPDLLKEDVHRMRVVLPDLVKDIQRETDLYAKILNKDNSACGLAKIEDDPFCASYSNARNVLRTPETYGVLETSSSSTPRDQPTKEGWLARGRDSSERRPGGRLEPRELDEQF